MENKLTTSWSPFDGDYQKKMQDIQLHDGTVIAKCWPNAGRFMCFSSSDQKDIDCGDVAFVRLTHAQEWEGQEEDEVYPKKEHPLVLITEDTKDMAAEEIDYPFAPYIDPVILSNPYNEFLNELDDLYGPEKKKKKPCTYHEYVKKGEDKEVLPGGTVVKEIWRCRHCDHPL